MSRQPLTGSSFADGFETGAIVGPTGRWERSACPEPGTSVAATSPGLEGTFKATLVDVNTVAGPVGVSCQFFSEVTPALAGSQYVRVWARVVTDTPGEAHPLAVQFTGGSRAVATVWLSYPGPTLMLAGARWDSAASAWNYNALPAGDWVEGRWHLLEVSVTGVGTATGQRRLWVDGALAQSQTVDWTGADGDLRPRPDAADRVLFAQLVRRGRAVRHSGGPALPGRRGHRLPGGGATAAGVAGELRGGRI